MKTLVIGLPESLPVELADNPDVIVVDPETLPEEVLAALNEASGGMLMEDDGETEGGEGPLEDWAGEEEKEHGMGGRADDEDEREAGMGDEDEREAGMGDDEEKDPLGGEGDEEEEKARGGSRGGKRGGGLTISGRGAAIPPLSAWARAMGRGAPR